MFEFVRNLFTQKSLPYAILVISSINVICIGGKRRTFGIFIAAFRQTFGNTTNMNELNWVGDSYSAVGFMLMPLLTSMVLRQGRRYRLWMFLAGVIILASCVFTALVTRPYQLFITHTALHGIGSSLVLIVPVLIIGEYFDKKHRFHVLATTAITGGPFGGVIFGPIFAKMITAVGWRVTFAVAGFILFSVATLASLVFFAKEADYDRVDQKTGGDSASFQPDSTTNLQKKNKVWAFVPLAHLRDHLHILLWFVERISQNALMYGCTMNLADFFTGRSASGTSLVYGSSINIVYSVGECLTFTAGLVFGDRIKSRLAFCYLVSSAGALLCLLVIQSAHAVNGAMLALTFVLGAFVGVGNTSVYATSEQVMALPGYITYPVSRLMAGIGMILSPLVSGYIVDRFRWDGFFASMIVVSAARTLSLAGINFVLLRRERRDTATQLYENVGGAGRQSSPWQTWQPVNSSGRDGGGGLGGGCNSKETCGGGGGAGMAMGPHADHHDHDEHHGREQQQHQDVRTFSETVRDDKHYAY